MTLVTRAGKGSALSWAEADANFNQAGADKNQTAAETTAGITPSDYTRRADPYDPRRYGAKFDNSNDDTTALTNAITVASQTVNGALGSAVTLTTGVSKLSSIVTLKDRVHILGINKRGSYFQATGGWSNGASAWNSGTAYVVGNYALSGGILYICTQANTNNVPPNASFWDPISNAIFYANNSFNVGNGVSMFDSTLQNLSVDANNINGLGCVLSSAWQEDCGLRGALLINFGSYGLRLQDGFGGASLTKVVDTEIFGGTVTGQTITGITAATSAVVTVSTTGTTNPFTVNAYINFSGVVGMTQINGLFGQITAAGGTTGAYTATVNINSSAFTAYSSGGLANNILGIDLTPPLGAVGAFTLDISNTSIVGGSGNLAACIACNGNSLSCRQVHFETAATGVLVDGVGHITLIDLTGNPTCTTLVTIASNFVGSLQMINCRRNGSTNWVVDNRVTQIATFGAITGGSSYGNGSYNNVPLTGGSGTGAQAQITVAGGAVTVCSIQVPGTGYAVADSLSASNTNLGGTGSGFSVPVATLFTGVGTLTQDSSYGLFNAADNGNIYFTGISPLDIIGVSGGNILIAEAALAGATANARWAVQVDTGSAYMGTINAKSTDVMVNNLTSTSLSTAKAWNWFAPTGGNAHQMNPADFVARGVAICKIATTIETRSSTTTLTNSTQLAYAIPGAGTYAFEVKVFSYFTTAVTDGITANMNFSGSFTAVGSYLDGFLMNGTTVTTGIQPVEISATVNNALTGLTMATYGASVAAATPAVHFLKGNLIATGAGTLAFAFAQSTSGVDTANLGVGSYMTVTQLS